ncbi:phage tail protein [Pseudoalteromonas sp. S16_S37]|uniref:phage tail protein n=1 Tax=Pseudoalteromonas sp. S16_S37 TaxID=2720228 RepID=UPI001680043C|nr:phage tail protein [Pseudoalteromonas sp. S16_S37]MBD1583110.1 phage tail protein [Pseudoalteromonas sp. S16_S37]
MIQELTTPMVGFRFAALITSAAIPNPIDIFFKEISGLKVSRSLDYEGNRVSVKSERQARTLTFKRGVLRTGSTLELTNFISLPQWNQFAVRNDILITLLNDNNLPTKAWLVTRAFMESWEWDSLDATRNDVLIESISFSYQSLVTVPIPFT